MLKDSIETALFYITIAGILLVAVILFCADTALETVTKILFRRSSHEK